MNKYQKRLHKEIKEFVANKNLKYKDVRKAFKVRAKYQLFSPCEDCDNRYCKKFTNKIAHCKDNM